MDLLHMTKMEHIFEILRFISGMEVVKNAKFQTVHVYPKLHKLAKKALVHGL